MCIKLPRFHFKSITDLFILLFCIQRLLCIFLTDGLYYFILRYIKERPSIRLHKQEAWIIKKLEKAEAAKLKQHNYRNATICWLKSTCEHREFWIRTQSIHSNCTFTKCTNENGNKTEVPSFYLHSHRNYQSKCKFQEVTSFQNSYICMCYKLSH